MATCNSTSQAFNGLMTQRCSSRRVAVASCASAAPGAATTLTSPARKDRWRMPPPPSGQAGRRDVMLSGAGRQAPRSSPQSSPRTGDARVKASWTEERSRVMSLAHECHADPLYFSRGPDVPTESTASSFGRAWLEACVSEQPVEWKPARVAGDSLTQGGLTMLGRNDSTDAENGKDASGLLTIVGESARIKGKFE